MHKPAPANLDRRDLTGGNQLVETGSPDADHGDGVLHRDGKMFSRQRCGEKWWYYVHLPNLLAGRIVVASQAAIYVALDDEANAAVSWPPF